MSTQSPMPEPPAAVRFSRRGWRDPRLVIGLVLVAASVLLGARMLAEADDTVEVWTAAHDLQAGQTLSGEDLVATRVRFADADRLGLYLPVADGVPEGVLRAPAASGALLPRAALGADAVEQTEVAVWAPAIAVPPSVGPGARVDVWVTGEGARDAEAVLRGVRVVAAPGADATLAASTERQVVLALGPDDAAQVGTVLAAAQAGQVAITRAG
ncbi:SAF domain-containing protein [Nocardioides dubius]